MMWLVSVAAFVLGLLIGNAGVAILGGALLCWRFLRVLPQAIKMAWQAAAKEAKEAPRRRRRAPEPTPESAS